MKTKLEKRKNNGVFYVVIPLLLVFGVFFGVAEYGKAQATKSGVAELTDFANSLKGDVEAFKVGLAYLGEDVGVNLGAVPGGDIYQPVTFYDTVGYGDGRNTVDTFHLIKSFVDATNTVVVFNPDTEGFNDFYLQDLWLENTGKATSTAVRICVTTSTAVTIAKDDATFLTEDAGVCTLMRTLGNAFGADGATFDSLTATSSAFHIGVYPGTNTQVINNDFGILINSTTNILVYATSTGDDSAGIKLTGNTFDGKLHIVGHTSTR
jgi:hypothetical protein